MSISRKTHSAGVVPSVLVVEDDAGLNRLICTSLPRIGIPAEGVATGSDAISRLASKEYSLLIVDYKLPDMNGVELVGKTRGSDDAVPFVVMTGQGDQNVAVEMMKLGALDYLVKDGAFVERFPHTVARALWRIETQRRLAQVRRRSCNPEEQPGRTLAIGELAEGVAHNYNNLFTVILGYTSLALMDLDPAGKPHEWLTQVLRSSERAGALTRELLMFSREERDRDAPTDPETRT